ncbi:putative MET16-3'-phosphoadenylylsulfate reductase [Clavulina sp. PMI_390]|nr:putative MET16-3'-phosphoadenylylsulfate reductase [Clavulina sp. PMI_390]
MIVLPANEKLALPLSSVQLTEINAYLSTLEPQQILAWGLQHLPNLYQSTAFGLTGLAGTDMLSKLTSNPPPLIFIDTLYHFPETLDLKDRVAARYNVPVHVYRPSGCETAAEFEATYGERLWETNDAVYDFWVKVEPAQRAYAELNAQSLITGRRSSQGAARATLQPLELDSTSTLLKLNPFFAWNFSQVKAYIDENDVPVNALLSQGYKSVGDWHSTVKSGEGDAGEREGRWKGKAKTECGLHVDYFALKKQAMKQTREAELREKDEAKDNLPDAALPSVPVVSS